MEYLNGYQLMLASHCIYKSMYRLAALQKLSCIMYDSFVKQRISYHALLGGDKGAMRRKAIKISCFQLNSLKCMMLRRLVSP